MTHGTRIALLGTGAMGTPMGRRLLGAGFALTVWNRTAARTSALAAAGADAARDPSDAVRDAEVVLSVLDRGETVTDVLFHTGVAQALNRGATVIDLSSIPPDTAREHAARLAEYGVSHLDAPVSGGTVGAGDGTLAIMVGGDRATFDRAEPVLRALGRPTLVGPSGAGQLTKLANQIIVGAGLAAIAEALTLVAAGGADPALARAAMAGGFADGPLLQLHGDRMLRRDFAPRGSAGLQLKDLDTALATASSHGLELPVTTAAEALYRRLVDLVGPDVDQSAVLLAAERTDAD